MAVMLRLLTTFVYVAFLMTLVNCQLEDNNREKLTAELQLDDLELADACEEIAVAKKLAFLTKNFQDKIEAEEQYGVVLKTHIEALNEFSDIPSELDRNWTYHVKPGDGLLPKSQWNKLVSYSNRIDELSTQVKLPCPNSISDCFITQNDYRNILRTSRNVTELKSVWSSWQTIYNDTLTKNFSDHLRLVKEAATLNGFETVLDYWESLNDFQGAYGQADAFWEELLPFYRNLHGFIRGRLFRYYNLTGNDGEIPVYFLGLEDWSSLANIILPHRQLHYDFELDLSYKTVSDIYKNAESIAKTLSVGSLGRKFWSGSNFNGSSCHPELFEYCNGGYTELVECNSPSWTTFLDAHDTAMKIALNNMDYVSLQRQRLRFSAIDASLGILGSLIAIEKIKHTGIVPEEEVKMTKLLLVALRVMPRLAYYYTVDKWRLMYLDEVDSDDVVKSWWKHRKQYQNVTGVTNKEADFLGDPVILNNRPYISKFFGILVAFQIFQYYKNNGEDGADFMKAITSDESLKTMVQERHTSDWSYLLTLHYGLDVSPSDLLAYFGSLEDYFVSAPLEQVPIRTTTTTTSTTTTTTTTTTPRSATEVPKRGAMENLAVNDEPAAKIKESGLAKGEDQHWPMYLGVGLLIMVGVLVGAALVYKNVRRKRRSNNRRFDT